MKKKKIKNLTFLEELLFLYSLYILDVDIK